MVPTMSPLMPTTWPTPASTPLTVWPTPNCPCPSPLLALLARWSPSPSPPFKPTPTLSLQTLVHTLAPPSPIICLSPRPTPPNPCGSPTIVLIFSPAVPHIPPLAPPSPSRHFSSTTSSIPPPHRCCPYPIPSLASTLPPLPLIGPQPHTLASPSSAAPTRFMLARLSAYTPATKATP